MNVDLTPAERRQAWWILSANTFAFTVCFAAWMMNGVLITYLVDNRGTCVESVGDGMADWHSRADGGNFSTAAGAGDRQMGWPHCLRSAAVGGGDPDVPGQLLPDVLAVLSGGAGIRLLRYQFRRRHCLHFGVVSQALAGNSPGNFWCRQRRRGVDQPGSPACLELAD